MDDCNAAETVSWEGGSHRPEPLHSSPWLRLTWGVGSQCQIQASVCRRWCNPNGLRADSRPIRSQPSPMGQFPWQ